MKSCLQKIIIHEDLIQALYKQKFENYSKGIILKLWLFHRYTENIISKKVDAVQYQKHAKST